MVVNSSMDALCASYNAKDVILYALAIGFGSDPERSEKDLRYLYEEQSDPNFSVVPTFCLALTFLADKGSGFNFSGIPSFPPPLMKSMGVLPRRFLRSEISLDDFPVLHTWQSISFHRDVPAPGSGSDSVKTILEGQFISVAPKSVGTFVTTEISVCLPNEHGPSRALCTMQSTALVLGVSSEDVVTFDSGITKRTMYRPASSSQTVLFEAEYTIPFSQALLYRLASGDSNKIHVNASLVPMLDSQRPLLHGLCTLGIATRFILQWLNDNYKHSHIRHLEARFSKPVFIGDRISVKVWSVDDTTECVKQLAFIIRNIDTGDIVVDKGCAVIDCQEAIGHSRL
jgi:acyl dehydratase